MKKPADETILKNAKEFNDILETFSEPRKTALKKMLDEPIGEHFFTAPASSRAGYHNCYMGGLLTHSLEVTRNLHTLENSDIFYKNNKNSSLFSSETLDFLGLFHDLGKAGDGNNEFYQEQESSWHQKQGILYKINPNCQEMPNSERTLFLLQYYGVKLSSEEFLAIRLVENDPNETTFYRFKEPTLALMLQFANRIAIDQEK